MLNIVLRIFTNAIHNEMSSRMILFHIYISLKKSWRSRYRVLLYKNLSLRKSWCLLSLQYNVSYFGIRCILNNVLLQLHYQININNINSAWLKGIPEFLGSGRKCWTLDSGPWTLGPGRWTLHFGRWALNTAHCRWLFENKIRIRFLILLD